VCPALTVVTLLFLAGLFEQIPENTRTHAAVDARRVTARHPFG